MQGTVKIKIAGRLIRIPGFVLRRVIAAEAKRMRSAIGFMTPEHHAVRNFVVADIASNGCALTNDTIAAAVGMDRDTVRHIVDELERNMVFLARDDTGEVSWAYPVTSDTTAHRIEYSDAKPTYGAWAIDALATPFVQGQLQGRRLTGAIHTNCACCGEAMCIDFDAQLNCHSQQNNAPVLSTPMINIKKLTAPNIIGDFWRRSLFFWSEEHARNHRLPVRAAYWDLPAAAYLTPIVQGALFGLDLAPVRVSPQALPL